MKLDVVSDTVCPWCYIGKKRLDQALEMHGGEGITLVSEGWTSMAHADLALRPLTAQEDIVPFSAVWSPSSDNPALRRFLSFARDLATRQRVRRHQ